MLDNPYLEHGERRAILVAWASDRYAVDSNLTSRELPGTQAVVPVKVILEALKSLGESSDGQIVKEPKLLRLGMRFGPGAQLQECYEKISSSTLEMMS